MRWLFSGDLRVCLILIFDVFGEENKVLYDEYPIQYFSKLKKSVGTGRSFLNRQVI